MSHPWPSFARRSQLRNRTGLGCSFLLRLSNGLSHTEHFRSIKKTRMNESLFDSDDDIYATSSPPKEGIPPLRLPSPPPPLCETIGIASLRSLTTLDLSRNNLRELPASIGNLGQLVSLDVSRNDLVGLPVEIGRLTLLTQLTALSNNLRMRLLPIDELVTLPALKLLDLRYNRKLKEPTRAALSSRLGAGVELLVTVSASPAVLPTSSCSKLSAGDRDATQLRSQLEPISTPQLRKRLVRTFGVDCEGVYDREDIMQRLLACYDAAPPRTIRYERGVSVRRETLDELLLELQSIVWPGTTRERPKVSAEHYMILQVPHSDQSTKRAKREAAKLRRYQRIWDKAVKAITEVDSQFADRFTALAVTKNFRGSPHIDTLNVGPFYGLSMGNFNPKDGGKICVECSPTCVAEVDTRDCLGKVDGRFPHWVTAYEGTRYSLIYYVTSGEVIPQTTAVFDQEGDTAWVPPPSFVL